MHVCFIVYATAVGAVSHLAEVSRKASQTQALEAVHFVLTAAAVQAWRACAFVDVPLAVLASVAGRAHTTIAIYQVLRDRKNKQTNKNKSS